MKRTMVMLLVFCLAILLIACSQATPAVETLVEQVPEATQPPEVETEPAAAEPVVLRVGGVQGIDCWNPYSCSDHWDYNDIVYEGFTGHGPGKGCSGVPRLAKSWEVSEDGLTWTLHLQEGVTYSDGTPFDANTAVEFIQWFNNTELKYWFYTSWNMTEIKALDDLTLQFTTEVPISNFPDYDGVWWWMLSPTIWGEFDDASLLTFEGFPPIGTGPYIVSEWVAGDHIVFDARPDYYQGKPAVDRIVYQQYANWDAMVQAFLAGEIDLTTAKLPPQYYDTLVSAPNTTVEERPPGEMYQLVFNMYEKGTKHPAINDQKVREAIDYAIDKQQLVDIALMGHGVTCPTNYACGEGYEGELNPELVLTPYDPEKARQILEEAGYVDSDGDGVRETQDGQPLEFRFYYAVEIPAEITMAESIKGWLADVGIKIEPEAQESSTLYNAHLDQRDFDMVIVYESADVDPAFLDFGYSCWSADAGSSALNHAGYCNKEVDDLTYSYITTANKEEALAFIFQAQAILNTDRPIILIGAENQIQAFNNQKFDFMQNTCDIGLGMWGYPGVINITVK